MEHVELGLNKLSEYLTNFLGFDFNLIYETRETPHGIVVDVIREYKEFKLPYINKLYENIFDTIENQLTNLLYTDYNNDIVGISNFDSFVEKVSLSILFDNFESQSEIQKIKVMDFIKALQELSFMTYESESVNMGIYVCKNNYELNQLMAHKQFDYVNVQNKSLRQFINSQKPLLKLIEKENFSIVVDNNFEVTGILKKKVGLSSIHEYQKKLQHTNENYLFIQDLIDEIRNSFIVQFDGDCCERILKSITENPESNSNMLKPELIKDLIGNNSKINFAFSELLNFLLDKLISYEYSIKKTFNLSLDILEDTPFISIQNKEIEFSTGSHFAISYRKGSWKVKSYVALAHEILAGTNSKTNEIDFLSQSIYPNLSEVTLETLFTKRLTKKQKDQTWKIVEKKLEELKNHSLTIFKIIPIVKEMSQESLGGLFVLISDKEYFYKNRALFVDIKNNAQEEYKNFIKINNQYPHVNKLDDHLIKLIASIDGATLLDSDFNILSFSEMFKSQNLQNLHFNQGYGSRTLAAISAASLGASIKISEDGDITIFRNVVYRDKKGNLVKRIEKVISF